MLARTRQELLRLKKREMLAIRGHKLLKEKQEELLRQLLSYISEVKKLKKEIAMETKETLKYFFSFLYLEKPIFFENLKLIQIFQSEVTKESISLLAKKALVHKFNILEEGFLPFYQTSSLFDIFLEKFSSLLKKLFRLSTFLKIITLLAIELEKTRRRVNVLEYRLIPQIKFAIRYISFCLQEYEREALIRIMKIKK